MIIQHNIMALNAHRQLGGNNSLVSKNLEKLSSGFKINRAGDDAAGLAISEKMRAQITGLTRAQANAQDGISLVQTAEGALTEVHSMLNRMVDLATQSSNGTIKDDDRQKIQDEMNALVEEIDRISQSTNFNGINLLDGSMGGASKGAVNGVSLELTKAMQSNNGIYSYTGATASEVKFEAANATTGTLADDDVFNFEFAVKNSDGTESTHKISFTVTDTAGKLTAANGNQYDLTDDGTALKAELGAALEAELNAMEGFKDAFTVVDDGNGELTISSKTTGSDAPQITMYSSSQTVADATFDGTGAGMVADSASAGADAFESLNLASVQAYDKANAAHDMNNSLITVNDKKFAFAKDAESAKELVETFGSDVNVIVDADGNGTLAAADATAFKDLLNSKAGLASEIDGTTTTQVHLKPVAGSTTEGTDGLVLQIGDTAEAFNKVAVSVENMGAIGLGIKGIKVTDQGVSAASMQNIKDAIEKVSTNRSAMGAMQNRLEHTINNLSVATENMTAAESRIRDVDMAKEMMHFTKNNVLSQAAQAMLAQANQQPQQVLQLLR